MPGISELIGRIIQLGQLRATLDAQQLARERFGLETQSTQAGLFGNLVNALPGFQDPRGFVGQNVEELAAMTGASPELLTSAAGQTPPSIPTQRAGATARGAAAAGSALDQPAAYANIAGTTPGSVAQDVLNESIYGGAQGFLNRDLTPEQRQDFNRRVLERTGSGTTPGAALFDTARLSLSPDEIAQATRIGADLAPGASASAQQQLGWASLRAQERNAQMQVALDEMRIRASLESHKGELDAAVFKETDDLVKNRAQFLVDAARTGQTLTPAGLESYRAQLNSYNARLRAIAPQVFGPGGSAELRDIPEGKNMTATSFLETLGAYFQRQK